MHIANFKLWMRGGSIGKVPYYVSLKLKVVVMCGDSKPLKDAMSPTQGRNISTLRIVL